MEKPTNFAERDPSGTAAPLAARARPQEHEQQGADRQIVPRSNDRLVDRIRARVKAVIGPDDVVAVISKGDDELLLLEPFRAWHFPQTPEGRYAGYHPRDSAEAIAHADAVRAKGATHLVIPSTAFWWLDYYWEFADHLDQEYTQLIGREDPCAVYALVSSGTDAPACRRRVHTPVDTTHARAAASEVGVRFRCNICGARSTARREGISRETASCTICRSTVRMRAIIHVLSTELFGASLALPDFPVNPAITGIGMTDWSGYAQPLAQKLSYTNTFYHTDPRLDITRPTPHLEGSLDFVISSEVFEHIAPPVSVAFQNLRRLINPSGLVVFTAPYGKGPATVEHFPDLHDYEIVAVDGSYRLKNVTRGGVAQEFENLVFHGGPGATLEMRRFSESSLLEEFFRAGFGNVRIRPDECPEYGIYWNVDWSLPIVARA